MVSQQLKSKPAVLVATHPRSGTHLTIDFLRRNFPVLSSRKKLGEPLDSLYVPIDIAINGSGDRVRGLINRHNHPILKSHWLEPDYSNVHTSNMDVSEWLTRNVNVIYVLRNPRKVLASHYLFQSTYASSVLDREEWLRNACLYWRNHVEKWTSRENVLILKFEDIVSDPSDLIENLTKELGIEACANDSLLPPRTYSKWHGRMYRLFSTNPPSTEILTPNQGKSFDDIFLDVDLSRYQEIVGDLVEKWNY